MKNVKDVFNQAITYHQAGDITNASVCYQDIHNKEPQDADVAFLLGTLCLQSGRPDTATEFLNKAIILNPDHIEAYNNLGAAYKALGRYSEAIANYNTVIRLKPDFAIAHNRLGIVLQEQGRFDEAAETLKRAIALDANNAEFHNNLGTVYSKKGQLNEAVKSYKRALKLQPEEYRIHSNLGAVLKELGEFEAALASCNKAISLNPHYAEAHNNIGTILQKTGRFEDAVISYKRALKLKPDDAELHSNLGSALKDLGRYSEASASCRRAIALDPCDAEAYNNLGTALQEEGKLDEAISCYRQAIGLKPDHAPAHSNLGITLQKKGIPEEAAIYCSHAINLSPDRADLHNNLGAIFHIQGKLGRAIMSYDMSIRLKPDYAEAHMNKSFALLLKGDYEEGWKEYEWRFRTRQYRLRDFRKPGWDGSPVKGKSVLVHAEQGFGDAIHFVRYLPMVRAQGAHIIFECKRDLIRLLKGCSGINEIVERTPEPSVQYDFHVPLLSLPGIFGTTLETIPSYASYIKVDSFLSEQWHKRVEHDNNYKIGIVWAGNPDNRKDHIRSCTLKDFTPLLEIPGTSFYSLQKGPASAEADNHPCRMKIINLNNELHDFADTASMIANLDLIISVDTAVVHLAGAIGKPVWNLLHYAPDWRWLLDRSDTPWYPGMRLFRQTKPNDWTNVFDQVKEALLQAIADCELRIADSTPAYHTRASGRAIPKSEIPARQTAGGRDSKLNDTLQEALNLHQAGNLTDAAILYDMLLEEQPENIDVIFLQGTLKHQQGNIELARNLLEKVTALRPDHASAYNNLGNILKDQHKPEEAMIRYKKAIALKPDYAMAHNNLGNVLKEMGRLEEAAGSCRRAIAIKPDYADAHNNLGAILEYEGKIKESISCYDNAIRLDPGCIGAHINKSLALLLTENFEDGWKEYEWRLHTKNCPSDAFPQPRWDGSPLKGKSILIYAEQGFGDTIQFVRYLPLVKAKGGFVIFQCQNDLLRLLRNCAGIDKITGIPSKTDITFDTHIPLLSLPGIFGTTRDTIPAAIPYIHSDYNQLTKTALEKKFQHNLRFHENRDFKTGIVWAGRSTFGDRYRSCSLTDFAPLAEIPHITFYSLQKGPASEELLNPPDNMRIIHLGDDLKDFADTAEVIAHLDLVICTDTAVAHLAGAMGKPTWALLHFAPDWRWFLNSKDTPWYPGMRLFRQAQLNDWGKVFEQVKKELMQTISDCARLPSFGQGLRIANCSPAHPTQRGGKTIPKSEIRNQKLKDMFQEALRFHQTGDFAAAIKFYHKILKLCPGNPMIHCNLGSALQELGNTDEALSSYRKAIELKHDYADAYYNLANALREQGKLHEAVMNYLEALKINPNYVQAFYNLGNTHREQGNPDDAIFCYKQATMLKPNCAEFHCNLGAVLQESGRLEDAITSYRQAITLKPKYAMAHSNLGSALQESGNLQEAIASYKNAIEINPDYTQAYNNLGTALKKSCLYTEAITYIRKALELKPDYAEAHNNLGAVLQAKGHFQEAGASHKRAIALNPDYAEAYNNLGAVQKELWEYDDAVINYKKAIELKPDYAEAHNNLGAVFQELGRHDEAITSYRQALNIKPDYASAHLNKSFALLLTETFKEGWQEYEWRLKINIHTNNNYQQPLWDGRPLRGKTILIHSEQGLGDTIQFVRYLPMVKAQGGRVVFECQKSLYKLLKNCDGIDIISEKSSHSKSELQFDTHIPLLSLPGIFNTSSDSIPSQIPYIRAETGLTEQWRWRLDHDKDFRVGIVWAGRPSHWHIYHKRSCSLKDFSVLTSIPGLSYYSLQKGEAANEVHEPPEGMKITNLADELSDFSDTAAVIANLDLVISIDTSVAHLAGALGKPVWTLLPFAPDWRWGLQTTHTPWYPGMKLFRQDYPNDWPGVFEEVKRRLVEEIKGGFTLQ